MPLGLASPPVGAPLVSVLGDIDGFRHDDLTISPPRGQHEPAHGTSRSLDYAELAPEIFVRLHHGPTRGAWSADGAGTWRDFATCPPAMKQGPGELAVSADGTRFLWLPQGGSAFVSTDRGGSWSASTGSPRDGGRWAGSLVAADRAEATRFYLYEEGRGRFYGSDDGGVSFQLRATGLPPEGRQLRAVPGRRGELWLATERGLLRSTDGGATFAYLGAVRSAVAVGFGKAAPGRDHPTVFLAGLVYGVDGLFRSDDVGATWVRIDDDTRRYGWVSHIIGDPRIYGRAYIGTSGRGILYGEPDRFFSLRP